jgi:predicted acetyltransferase
MSLCIRQATSQDLQQCANVWSVAFRRNIPFDPQKNIIQPEDTPFVAEQNGKILGAFIAKQMKATRRNAVLEAIGIASVAVLPEFRNQGVADVMMRFAIQWMREQNYHISSLYPFRESYYRRFGWETCGNRVRVKCPTHRLPQCENPLTISQTNDWKNLQTCYEDFAKKLSGMNIRQESFWSRIIDPKEPPPLIYTIGQPVQAYCILRFTDSFWDTQDIAETAWTSQEGYKTLLSLFKSIGANKTAITWREPRAGIFQHLYADQGVQIETWRPIMFRVINVPNALAKLKPNASGEFTIAVQDEILPQNFGPWKVGFEPEAVHVQKAEQADITVSIQQFTQAFLGEPSLQTLADEGLLMGQSAALEAANRLFKPTPVYCMDFF